MDFKYNKNRNIKIGSNSIVDKSVILSNNIEIRHFCVIGDEPIAFEYFNKGLKKTFRKIIPRYTVVINNNVYIGSHSIIMKGLERNTVINNNVIIGQYSNIGHDSIIENYVRIMNNVSIEGFCIIKKGVYIGVGSNIRNRITIGENSLIGMGSNVVKDIPKNVVGYGNPCKVIRRNFNSLEEIIRSLMI